MTYSEILFKTLVKYSTMAEKRLMIDILSAREALEKRKARNIALIRSHSNIADALTKVLRCVVLEKLLLIGILPINIEQWSKRPELTSSGAIRTSSYDLPQGWKYNN